MDKSFLLPLQDRTYMGCQNILLWSTLPHNTSAFSFPETYPYLLKMRLSVPTKHRTSPQIIGNMYIFPSFLGSTLFLNIFYYSTELCQSNNIPAYGHATLSFARMWTVVLLFLYLLLPQTEMSFIRCLNESSERIQESILYLLVTHFTFPCPPNIAPTSLTHSTFWSLVCLLNAIQTS